MSNLASTPKEATKSTTPRLGPDEYLLRATDWPDIIPRLIAYANFRASRYGRSSVIYRNRAEDYAQDAIQLFLDGTRRFVPSPAVSLFKFLCGVVDSLISHDVEKAARRPAVLQIVNLAREEVAIDCVDEDHLPSSHDVERQVLSNEEVSRLLDWLEPDLRALAEARMVIEGNAADYARMLGKRVSDVRNMEKRLKRRRVEWEKS